MIKNDELCKSILAFISSSMTLTRILVLSVIYLFIIRNSTDIDQSNHNNAIVNRTFSITLTKKDKIELLVTTISNTNVVFFASIEDDCI